MTSPNQPPPLPQELSGLLRAVRRRIRGYVAIEGLGVVLAAAGLAFWASLAVDFFFEPPAWLRLVFAAVGVAVVGALLWRHWLGRLLAPLPPKPLALLLERRFPRLGDALHTAVELNDAPGKAAAGQAPIDDELLRTTVQQAVERARGLRLGELFDSGPITRSAVAGLLMATSVGMLLASAPQTAGTWARRYFRLSAERWPRQTHLMVEGFPGGVRKVARGRDTQLRVGATLAKRVPGWVEVRFRTEQGVRGRANLRREGRARPDRDEFQIFTHTFDQVLSSLELDVAGGDDRLGGLRIEVVEEPVLVDVALQCQFPEYLGRPPAEIPATAEVSLPAGTRVTLKAHSNKPLVEVELRRSGSEAAETAAAGGRPAREPERGPAVDSLGRASEAPDRADSGNAAPSGDGPLVPVVLRHHTELSAELGPLAADETWLLTLRDRDGISTLRPIQVSVRAVPDRPPTWQLQTPGVSSAITARAQIPVVGLVQDDYGLDACWWQWSVDSAAPSERPSDWQVAGRDRVSIAARFDVDALGLEPGQRLALSVVARDRCGWGKANTAVSDWFRWEIVTPETLHALLAAREVNLRRSLETLAEEVTEGRRQLLQLGELPGGTQPAEGAPADGSTPSASASALPAAAAGAVVDEAEPPVDPRDLAVVRLIQLARKNTDELLGLAAAVEGIRDEMVHNQIDTPQLQSRLSQAIAAPLRSVASQRLPRLVETAEQLRLTLGASSGFAQPQQEVGRQYGEILAVLDQVLGQMRELETFNEAVDTLREIIAQQEKLNQQTQAERKRKARRLLDD